MAGAPVSETESWNVGGGGGAAFETLGKAKATPTIAVVRISFSFITGSSRPKSLVVRGLPLRTGGFKREDVLLRHRPRSIPRPGPASEIFPTNAPLVPAAFGRLRKPE